METYTYLNNYYKTPPERFFKKNGERTRGHSQKLFKKRARLDQKTNFFPVKMVGKSNDLLSTRKRGRSCNQWQLQEEIDESSTLSSEQLERTSDKLYK